MSLAAETRAAVRERPLLFEALRAGVVNYTAAARSLEVGGDTDAVTAALRRFAADLAPREPLPKDVRVTMHSGLQPADEGVLAVGDSGYSEGDGDLTGIMATGDVDATALEHVLGVLRIHDIDVVAAGVSESGLVVVVDRRNGAETLRRTETALDGVPG